MAHNITPASFIAERPEFEGAPEAMLQTAIDNAAKSLLEDMLRETYDEAVSLGAAHRLALSPYGQSAKLVAADGSTTYSKQLDVLVRDAGVGFRVV